MNRSFVFILSLATIAASLCYQSTFAQVPPQAINQGLNTVELDGELKGAQGNYIQIQQASGTMAVVQLPQEPRSIQFEATLKPSQLNQSMLVRFNVPFEELQGESISLTQISVFSIQEVGKFKPRSDRERADYMPGIYPLAQLGNDPNSKDVQVVAKIVGLKDKTLIVNAGRPIQIVLSDETELKFTSNSLQLAKPGDNVKGSGLTRDPQASQIAATRIVILGSLPEAEPTLADGKTNKSKRRGKKSKASKADTEEMNAEGETQTLTPEEQPVE